MRIGLYKEGLIRKNSVRGREESIYFIEDFSSAWCNIMVFFPLFPFSSFFFFFLPSSFLF